MRRAAIASCVAPARRTIPRELMQRYFEGNLPSPALARGCMFSKTTHLSFEYLQNLLFNNSRFWLASPGKRVCGIGGCFPQPPPKQGLPDVELSRRLLYADARLFRERHRLELELAAVSSSLPHSGATT